MSNPLARLVCEISSVRRILLRADYRRWLRCLVAQLPQVISRRSLDPVDEAFGEVFTLQHRGRMLHIRGASFGLGREIFGQECYASAGELADARHVLDLGANAGIFGLFALSSAPQARVHMVEAQSHFIAVIDRNIAASGLAERATVENALVGGEHDSWTMELRQTHPALPDFAISDYLKKVGVCDFLKCDVEGAEYLFLAGDLSWLACVKRIALEYHGNWQQGAQLAERLRGAGFTVRQTEHGALGYLRAARG